MKKIRLDIEAKRHNVSVEAVKKIFNSLISEGKIWGLLDEENQEFIFLTSQELSNSVILLRSNPVLFKKKLAKELNLSTERTRPVIRKLIEEDLLYYVTKFLEEKGRIDIPEISDNLPVSEDAIRKTIKNATEKLIIAIKPLEKIKLSDLSKTTGLSDNFIVTLFNGLTSKGEILGFANRFTRNQMSQGLIAVIDAQGHKRWGTSKQVENWKKQIENLKKQVERVNKALENNFKGYTPTQFRRFIAELFNRMGYEVGDYGLNLIAEKNNEKILIRAEQYYGRPPVRPRQVRDVSGTLEELREKAKKAVFIVTANFSVRAKEQARINGIELWNLQKLKQKVEEYFLKMAEANTDKEEKLVREELELENVKFVDRHGRELWGTPEQVKEWKKVDQALQDNFVDWHPREFEKFVAKLLGRMGYEVNLTPYVGDYGVDIMAKKDNIKVAVQVKKYYARPVEYEDVKDFLGAMRGIAEQGLFVTTSDFTPEVYTRAQDLPIELWNRWTLEKLVERYFMRAIGESALKKEEGTSSTETIRGEEEMNIYKEAYPELSEEEAELQETQEIDMDFEDEDM